MEARRLLAEAYRIDGYIDAAGLWEYLETGRDDDEARAAFERSCAHRRGPGWTATSTLNALAWPSGAPAPSDDAASILAHLVAAAAEERAAWGRATNPAPTRIAQRAAGHVRKLTSEKARKARRREG